MITGIFFTLSHFLTRSIGLGPELSLTGVVAAQSSAAQLVKLFLGYVTSQAVAEYFVRFECGRVCDCSFFNFYDGIGFAGVEPRSTEQTAPILGASR